MTIQQQSQVVIGELLNEMSPGCYESKNENRQVWLSLAGETLQIEFDQAWENASVQAPIMNLESGNDYKQLELMLRYNFLWQSHQGLHVKIDSHGMASLVFQYPVGDLTLDELQCLIGNFLLQVVYWRNLLEAKKVEQGTDVETMKDTPALPDMSAWV